MSHSSNVTSATSTLAYQQSMLGSMFKAAGQIAGEAKTAGSHSLLDQKRHALSQYVYQNGVNPTSSLVQSFCLAALENGGSTADNDAACDAQVSAVWNNVAGVASGD